MSKLSISFLIFLLSVKSIEVFQLGIEVSNYYCKTISPFNSVNFCTKPVESIMKMLLGLLIIIYLLAILNILTFCSCSISLFVSCNLFFFLELKTILSDINIFASFLIILYKDREYLLPSFHI